MNIAPRTFWFPSGDRYVLFTPEALAHMYVYQQNRPWDREAGGELFAPDPDANSRIIVATAGPDKKDVRRRRFFNQDAQAATAVREKFYEKGLHATGLWHTHPQKHPIPSAQDKETAKKYFDDFDGTRKDYLLLVVGNKKAIPNIAVWSIGSTGWVELVTHS